MKAMRRFGLLIGILLIGIIIGHFGSLIALLIVAPLFTLWLSFWDDKKLDKHNHSNTIMKQSQKNPTSTLQTTINFSERLKRTPIFRF